MTIEEYYNKRKKRQLDEAIEFVNRYEDVYRHEPPLNELREYFFLFAREKDMCDSFEKQLNLLGNKTLSLERLEASRIFTGYSDFLQYCREHK